MVRSLWTAAAGMTSQQTNVDTISNNLANVNTTGYKMETTHFKSLYISSYRQRPHLQTVKQSRLMHRLVWVQEYLL